MDEEQARSIALSVGKAAPPRPLTFMMVADLVKQAGVKVEGVCVNQLRGGTFYAVVKLKDGKEVDARPSDAINLALTLEIPIYAAEEVLEEVGVKIPLEEGTEAEFEPKGIPAIIDDLKKKWPLSTGRESLGDYVMSLRKKK